jgi:hypothetical protein
VIRLPDKPVMTGALKMQKDGYFVD